MKKIENDNMKKQNERIISLIEELNSTLDLYYEKNIDKDFFSIDKKNLSTYVNS